jgi:predicted hotdog family 3-hydroxylacyl-ACP dehydratase
MPRLLENSQHWRERANSIRALAEQTSDPDVRRGLLASAREYERLAERADGHTHPTKAK